MEKQVYGIIYMIQNKINGKIYFGQTKHTFEKRYNSNDEKIVNDVSNEHLRNSINKYGINNFYINRKFDVAYSKEELDELEDLYICMYETINPKYGYNKKRGGSNPIPNEEARRKMSESHKGSPHLVGQANPFWGKTHTEETKRLMSEHHYDCRGEKHPQFGKPKSSMTRKKISEKLKENRENGEKPHRSKKVLCVTTGEIFETIKAGAIKYNCNSSDIIRVCKKERKSCGKLKDGTKLVWEYVKEEL